MIKKISALAMSFVMVFGLSSTMVSATTDDYGDSFSTATAISVDQNISGNIDFGGDNDYFKFVAPRAGYYTIFSTGDLDTYGYLYNSSGIEETHNDDGSLNGDVYNFRMADVYLNAGDVYYIRVRDFDTIETGSYGIRIIAPAYSTTDDHSDSFIGASSILPKTNVVGRINFSNDYDYFIFQAPTTGTYTIKTTGSIDTYGFLLNSNKILLSENDDGTDTGLNFSITATLTKDQYYYVIVKGQSNAVLGNYVLNVIPQ